MTTQRNISKHLCSVTYFLGGFLSCAVIISFQGSKTSVSTFIVDNHKEQPHKDVQRTDIVERLRTVKEENTDLQTKAPTTREPPALQCDVDFMKWQNKQRNAAMSEELKCYRQESCNKEYSLCETSGLVGPLVVQREAVTLDWLKTNELDFVQPGGWWSPEGCRSRKEVAIVIPFRKREEHLPLLLRQLHPILKRQQLHYRVFVVEQVDASNFNRGKLMNVGYREALRHFPYKCFVFHDVDLIPENDNIDYGCRTSPAHLSVAIDKFHYQLPYGNIFGGIEMMTGEDYKELNGFPNSFWYWGGEDDNVSFRIRQMGMQIHRQSLNTARYTMIKHGDNSERISDGDLGRFLRASFGWVREDGLNSLYYDVKSTEEMELYTLVKVDLRKDLDKKFKY